MEKLIEQVPSLLVLSFIVIKFLQALNKKDLLFEDLNKETTKVIRENSRILGQIGSALSRWKV